MATNSNKEYSKISNRIDGLMIGSIQFLQEAAWCSDRIDWAWKFRKISKMQMEELCDRMIELFDECQAMY